jgi:holliday junction DNA helicase RuvA
MISYLEGKLIWSDKSSVIVSPAGIGYEVNYENSYVVSEYGSIVRLFITHKISEYGESLYGFLTIDEKIIFDQLENIKGIGSKAIFTIMSSLQIKTISDLQNISLDQLVKLPGVGKATAQKFLLALSGKLKKEFSLEYQDEAKNKDIETLYKSEIELLVEWGMKKSELVAYLRDNSEVLAETNSDKLIRRVLKDFKK